MACYALLWQMLCCYGPKLDLLMLSHSDWYNSQASRCPYLLSKRSLLSTLDFGAWLFYPCSQTSRDCRSVSSIHVYLSSMLVLGFCTGHSTLYSLRNAVSFGAGLLDVVSSRLSPCYFKTSIPFAIVYNVSPKWVIQKFYNNYGVI